MPHLTPLEARVVETILGRRGIGGSARIGRDAAHTFLRVGARTIALTNSATSPLAGIADVVLRSTAQGSPLLGENAAARIAQLVILDAVFAAVASRDLAAAERNLAATMGAVKARRRTP